MQYYRTPDYATWADHLTKEYEEGDDELHDPELDTQDLDASGTIWTRRGVMNLGGMGMAFILLIVIMYVVLTLQLRMLANVLQDGVAAALVPLLPHSLLCVRV